VSEPKLAALSDWVRDWQIPLRRFLSGRRGAPTADVEDIAQEVFMRLLRYDRTELVNHPRAYLFKIAANVAAEWSMRASCRLPHDSSWLDELVDAMSPEVSLDLEKGDQRLEAALRALPARAREILRLHFHEGMSRPQIAQKLGVTRKIVKRDTARAYAALRSMLGSHDVMGPTDPWNI